MFYTDAGRICSGEGTQALTMSHNEHCHPGSGSWGTGPPVPKVSGLAHFQKEASLDWLF